MLLKVTEKVSLDRNAKYNSIHRIYGYRYCSLFLLLFIMYMITVTVLLLSPHRPSNVVTRILIV